MRHLAVLVLLVPTSAWAWGDAVPVRGADSTWQDAVLADLDGDGDLDLVGLTVEENKEGAVGHVAWWENPGGAAGMRCDGSPHDLDDTAFGWVKHTLGQPFADPGTVRAGDIDGDGDIDVLADSASLGGVLWWSNDDVGEPGSGDASSFTVHTFGDPQQPHRPELVDFDGDGDLDMVSYVYPASRVSWWENTGDGWTEHIVVQATAVLEVSLQPADFDGDGDMDIAVSRSVASEVAWYENNDGGWLVHTVHPNAVTHLLAADMDDDGDVDLVGGPRAAGHAFVYTNRLDDQGDFRGQRITTESWVTRLAVADADADGDLDVWIGYSGEDRGLSLFANNSGGYFEQDIAPWFDGAGPLRSGDIDGDGDEDLMALGPNGTAWFAWDGAFTRYTLALNHRSSPAPEAAVGDFEGDGTPDVAVSIPAASALLLYENAGIGARVRCIDDEAARVVSPQAVDVDGDGDSDLAGFLYGEGRIAWWERQDGGAWTQRHLGDGYFIPEPGVGPGQAEVRFVDVDDDGDIDAVGAGPISGGGGHFWHANPGPGDAAWIRRGLPLNRVQSFGLADGDGDGDIDVLGVYTGGSAWALNSDAGQSWDTSEVASAWNYGTTVLHRAGDFDHDGDADVLRIHSPAGNTWTVDVLRNDAGAPPWDGAWPGWAVGSLAAPSLGDVDDDGLLDVVGGINDRLFAFSHDGALETWTADPVVSDALGAASTHLADLDGDGDEDLWVATTDGSLLWIPNELPQIGHGPPGDDDDDDDDDTGVVDDDDVVGDDDDDGGCGASMAGAASPGVLLIMVTLGRRRAEGRRRPED